MKMNMNWSKAFLAVVIIALGLSGVISFGFPSRAHANPSMFCRDCPFPAKIADGRWLMPNGVLQIEIDAQSMPKGMTHFDVTLRDARNGNIIARGIAIQKRDRRTLLVDLMDHQGRIVKGLVHYVDGDQDKIQARFSCAQCSIGAMLE